MAGFRLCAFADEADSRLSGQIEALKANGVRFIELRGVNGKSVADLTDGEAREARSMLEGEGIGIAQMGSPYGKYPIREPFAPHRDAFKRGLELCDLLGTRKVRMFSFFMAEGEDPSAARGEVLDRLAEMLELAESAGVRLCHENERGIYGDVTGRCEDLMGAYGDRMGFVFDPANFLLCGVRIKDAFARLRGFVDYLHLKDAEVAGGAIVPCGEGDGEIPWLIRELSAAGGEWTLSVEPHLTVFDGLSGLQSEGLTHKFAYPSKRAAFDAAVSALKGVLSGQNLTEGEAGVWRP